ncbi:MAG: serine/threonine protein kinase [Ignavibacteriales bacterium]|nr:serine/threonine protein kinase [Ignavibacteriales bacterium]
MSSLTSEILFEKFQIIEVLKKDEHAAVFLANHIYLSKKIILKVLNTQKLPDPSMVERFKREGKILAKLDHPNIIKVLDFGMSKEFFYISFEYIEGESLRNIFKTKTLSPEQKEHVMIQILKGLDYAHKNQIIHRDIKPENIFVDKNLNVKLGDFGLALSAEDNFVTNPYSIVGTPSYMSPEQVRGAKLTPQSDIFSTGVVLFELFTGKNPFLRDNVSLTLNVIMAYDENEVAKMTGDQPELIKEILFNMLKKNMTQRYESAEEILDELNVHVDQPTIVINNVDREGNKSKLAWIFIAVIFLGIVAIFVVPMLNQPGQNKIIPGGDKGNILNNNSSEPNSTQQENQQAKDQVDLNNLNKPLVDNKNSIPAQDQNTDSSPKQDNKVGMGWLDVQSFPVNAGVSISGESYGPTPFDKRIPILSGEYSVVFTHPKYPTFYKNVTVEAGKVTLVHVNIEEETMGFIYCSVFPPVGDIYIGGTIKAEAPMIANKFIKVVPGPVDLKIKNPMFKDIDTSFVIKARDTLKLKFRFKNN